MASNRAVATALKILGRAFAGIVDEHRIEVYAAALEDLSDGELATATAIVVKTHLGEFIPPPAVIRKAVAPAVATVDGEGVLRQVAKLATYTPTQGMIYPRVDLVRERLGDVIAYAYAAAGGTRVFSDNDTTRDIATREFVKAMTDAVNRPGADLPIIGAPGPRIALPSARRALEVVNG